MIVFITTKQNQKGQTWDDVEVLGAFHTLNQAKDAAPDVQWHEISKDARYWGEDKFYNDYTITRVVVPKAEFEE